MTVFTWLWIAWIVMFLIVEGIALYDKNYEGTLSHHVWKWFAVKGKGKAVKVRRFGLLVMMAWLSVHFLTGGYI